MPSNGQHGKAAVLSESEVIESWESEYCLSREQVMMVEPDESFQYLVLVCMLVVLLLGVLMVFGNLLEQMMRARKRAGKCAAAEMVLSFGYLKSLAATRKQILEEQVEKERRFIDDGEEREPTKYET